MSRYVKNPKSIQTLEHIKTGIEPGSVNIIAVGRGTEKSKVKQEFPKPRRKRCSICNELKEKEELRRLTDKKTRKLSLVCVDCEK